MLIAISLFVTFKSATLTGVVSDSGHPVQDAVVWLEGKEKPNAGHAIVDQRHQMFSPHIQVVPVGSKVDFPNNDDVFHNVYAEFQAKRFDLGVYPRGKSKQVTFDKAGVVTVVCNVHSPRSAYIVVVDTPFFAKTDGKGRFSIPNVPNHSFTVHVWHESGRSAVKKLDVVTANSTIQLPISR